MSRAGNAFHRTAKAGDAGGDRAVDADRDRHAHRHADDAQRGFEQMLAEVSSRGTAPVESCAASGNESSVFEYQALIAPGRGLIRMRGHYHGHAKLARQRLQKIENLAPVCTSRFPVGSSASRTTG